MGGRPPRANGLSQRQAAKAIGVDPTTWRGWETGHRRPEGEFAQRIKAFIETWASVTAPTVGPWAHPQSLHLLVEALVVG
jgi:transcriptional regulator with XRE-family HTH domain